MNIIRILKNLAKACSYVSNNNILIDANKKCLLNECL